MATASFKLRLPEAMRARLEESTKESGNSLNTEILWRLGRSFEMDKMREALRESERQHRETQDRLNKMTDYALQLTAPKVRAPKTAKTEDAA